MDADQRSGRVLDHPVREGRMARGREADPFDRRGCVLGDPDMRVGELDRGEVVKAVAAGRIRELDARRVGNACGGLHVEVAEGAVLGDLDEKGDSVRPGPRDTKIGEGAVDRVVNVHAGRSEVLPVDVEPAAAAAARVLRGDSEVLVEDD